MELNELQKIETREEFISFLNYLRQDFVKNSKKWENQSLEEYLEAMQGWVSDMDGFYKNQGLVLPTPIPWKVFANILFAARMYE